MSFILCLETATEVCSVALLSDGVLLASEEDMRPNAHASQITLLIERVMRQGGAALKDLAAVAVSKGPGSYTGLRVGVSTAKGLCYSLGIPLIAVNSLESLAAGFVKKRTADNGPALFVPMFDARRMEVYSAIFDGTMIAVRATQAEVIDENSFGQWLSKQPVYFFGTGAAKCSEVIKHPNAVFIHDMQAGAAYMSKPAFRALEEKHFEDVAYFEPFYLKDFAGTKPKSIVRPDIG